jgi:hypothetical protein
MIEVKVNSTEKGLEIEFINLLNKPLLQYINTEFILLQLDDRIYKESKKTIRDLLHLHYQYLNNHFDLEPQQKIELDNWFNKPVDELLKHLDDESLELIKMI